MSGEPGLVRRSLLDYGEVFRPERFSALMAEARIGRQARHHESATFFHYSSVAQGARDGDLWLLCYVAMNASVSNCSGHSQGRKKKYMSVLRTLPAGTTVVKGKLLDELSKDVADADVILDDMMWGHP